LFGFLKKKSPRRIDQVIAAIYGNTPPPRTANIDAAIHLAHQELLGELVTKTDVARVAKELLDGPMPYSTRDLALNVALHFFRTPELHNRLKPVNGSARALAQQWARDTRTRIPPRLIESFEDSLNTRYGAIEEARAIRDESLKSLQQVPQSDADEDPDDQDSETAQQFREWAADRGIALTEKTSDALIAKVFHRVVKGFPAMPEHGIEHVSVNTCGFIVLQMLKLNELSGTQFMWEHLAYQVNYYRENGLRPEYADGVPFPAGWE
jgi:hypothetical protein